MKQASIAYQLNTVLDTIRSDYRQRPVIFLNYNATFDLINHNDMIYEYEHMLILKPIYLYAENETKRVQSSKFYQTISTFI